MAVQLALPGALNEVAARLKLPKRVPPFNTAVYRLFWLIWAAALCLAIVGPVMGLYLRSVSPENNSQLVLGSRAGFAVAEPDATRIRFPVGPEARQAGIRSGDDIVAVFGLPLPDVLPVTEQALARNADDPSYIAIGNLLFGTETMEVPLTLRSTDGRERDVVVVTGERHITAAAREWGIPPRLLSFIDLVHVIAYPFLLWAAWILHRRNARDAVSSVLSLAILLAMGTEQPSSIFLTSQGIPRSALVLMYDVSNICLLTGILLFPHGRLSPRVAILILLLPVLTLLRGDLYQGVLFSFMIVAVLMLLRCLRETPDGSLRQQIRWALFGFAGYGLFRGLSILGDMFKMSADAFGSQILIELLSGVALGMAILILQLGLLIALLRFRLYDAESFISRTASIAIVTLVLGAVIAGVMEGIITQMQNIYEGSQTPAAMIGAIMATMLLQPLHGKVQAWAERRFHRKLLDLREGLPDALRDLREIADVDEFVHEVLTRINQGVYSIRSAFILDRQIKEVTGIPQADVARWLMAFETQESEQPLQCKIDDPMFPLRLRIEDDKKSFQAWVLIGPRPDGSVAGGDEREALGDVAGAVGRSLRIVLKREQEQAELADVIATNRTRIERLEQALKIPS
ncbi:MAG: hypothetical protein M3Q52_06405 [Pseudomonadota bacterium]|nr:hypothetical protein [Pseudomonadota bacterium]